MNVKHQKHITTFNASQGDPGTVNPMSKNTILVADLTNLIHRAWHATGRPGTHQVVTGRVVTWLADAVSRTNASELALVLDDPAGCTIRKNFYPDYKGGRPEKEEGLKNALEGTPKDLHNAGIHYTMVEGCEADDVLAATSLLGLDIVLMTSDRDAYSLLLGENTRLLRLVNGGADAWPLIKSDQLSLVCGVDGTAYPLYSAIRGDASDNMPGLPGLGEKLAGRLVEVLPTLEELLRDWDNNGEETRKVAGKAKTEKLLANRAEMEETLRRNLTLSGMLPDTPAATPLPLPLDLDGLSKLMTSLAMSPSQQAHVLETLAGAVAERVEAQENELEAWVEGEEPAEEKRYQVKRRGDLSALHTGQSLGPVVKTPTGWSDLL